MICEKEGGSRTARAEQRRQAILEAARQLFVEHGFHRTGMAQIAERSGVKVGQIYRDFANKEQIITAICEADLATTMREETLAQALRNRDAPALREWLHNFCTLDQPLQQSRLMAEIMAEAGRNAQIAASLRAIEERVNASMAAAFDVLTPAEGQRARQEEINNIIMALHVGAMMRMAVNPLLPTDDIQRYVSELLERALCVDPAGPCAAAMAGAAAAAGHPLEKPSS